MIKNQEKTISANSKGIVITYGDAKKHQYMRYNRYVRKIQQEGTVKYQIILNPAQEKLYQKLVFGFQAFNKEEIELMSENTKLEIKIGYTKTHRILNKWKQDIIFKKLDELLLHLFPKSTLVKQLAEIKGHVNEIPSNEEISFREIGIYKKDIIAKLIEHTLLPKNFFQIA